MVAATLTRGQSTAELVLGSVGFFTAFFVIISPWPTFNKIRKTKDVGTTKPYSYLAVVFNSATWVIFGIPVMVKLTRDHVHHTVVDFLNLPLMLANIAGVIVELGYVLVFIWYAAPGNRRWPVVSLVAAVLVSIGVLALYLATGWSRTFVGFIAMFSGVAVYVIPVISTYTAYKNNDYTQISPYQASASVVNGAVWTAYSCIRCVHAFVFVPNVVAILCAGGQLTVRSVLKNRAQPRDIEAGLRPGVDGSNNTRGAEEKQTGGGSVPGTGVVVSGAGVGVSGAGDGGVGAGGGGKVDMSEVELQDVADQVQQEKDVAAQVHQLAEGVQGAETDEIPDDEDVHSEVKNQAVLAPGGGNTVDEVENQHHEPEGGDGYSSSNNDDGTQVEEAGEDKAEDPRAEDPISDDYSSNNDDGGDGTQVEEAGEDKAEDPISD